MGGKEWAAAALDYSSALSAYYAADRPDVSAEAHKVARSAARYTDPLYISRRQRLRFRVPQVLANRSLAHLHLAQSAAADEAKRGERPAEHVMEALGGDTVAAAMTKGAIGAAQAPLPMLL